MLEDDFCDILRKASRGTGLDAAALAARSGLPAAHITRQVANGVAVRMAVLFLLLGQGRAHPSAPTTTGGTDA